MDERQLTAATRLNEGEMWRDLLRRSRGLVVEDDGLLLLAGPVRSLRVAMRTQPRLPAAQALTRSTEFFTERGSAFTLVVTEPDDEDLAQEASRAGFEPGWREVGMMVRRPVEDREPREGIALTRVETPEQVSDYGRVVTEANDYPESERAQIVFSRPESILAPHIAAFVAYLGKDPVSTALTLVSHRVAGVFWVATVERARRQGLGGCLTRAATNAGFEMGAAAAWLGSSEMGAGLYRRLGYEEFGPRYQEYEAPSA